jgi:hypothetical protein
MTTRSAVLAGVLFCVSGCGGSVDVPTEGRIQAKISMLTASAQVDRVTVTVTPANVTKDLTYNSADGSFAGTIAVPPGTQTVTATAYSGSTVIGSGSSSVTISVGATATVSITITDTTGGAPIPDHSPVITSFAVPRTNVALGEILALSVAAMDADNNVIVFSWTASPVGCGTFSDATSASPSWTAASPGVCTVKVTAMAQGKTDTRSTDITIQSGSVAILGSYVPFPKITSIYLDDTTNVIWSCPRDACADATWHTPLMRSKRYWFNFYFAFTPGAVTQIEDTCGGAGGRFGFSEGSSAASGYAYYDWDTPAYAGACIVTAKLTRAGLTDSFPVVFVVQ